LRDIVLAETPWVADADKCLKDKFYMPGYDVSGWSEIQVPGMWELNGYGDPLYVNSGFPWKGNFENNPPQVPDSANAIGTYRRTVRMERNGCQGSFRVGNIVFVALG
jgi:beta-galactosidase